MNEASRHAGPRLRTPVDDSLPTRSSLLGRLRNLSDNDSWRTFFENYWRLIYNVACKSGLHDQEAQDVVQETVIAVARKIPEFRYDPARGSFKQWLLLITRRRIHDHLRRVYRSIPITEGDRRLDALVAPTPTPDEQIDTNWEAAWRDHIFQAALTRVRHLSNPRHYQVFDYCVLQNIPSGEAARLLGLSAAQIYLAKHRVSRAVKRAAAELEAELERPAD